MGEIVVYTSALTATQIQQVQSYYALKYGITLDQATPYNYLASDGTITWNATANSGFNNNITGIGQDNNSALDQKQSRSANTTGNGNMLTIGLGTIAATNAANSNAFSADRSFLVWGDNGGDVTGGSNSTDIPDTYSSRLNRLWKAQVTGTGVGQVQVQFDLNGITHAGTTSSDFVLLIKRGGSNTTVLNESGATYVAVPAASYASGIVTFDGVSFQDNDIFALVDDASDPAGNGPGGVTDGLALWLRPDVGVTANGSTVSQWSDQSGVSNNMSQSDPAQQPVYNTSTNLLNFNPTLGFSNMTDNLSDPDGIFGAGPYTAANCFVMARTDATGGAYAFAQVLTEGAGFGMTLGSNQVTWAGPSISLGAYNEVTSAVGTVVPGVPYLWSGLNNNSTETLRRNGLLLNDLLPLNNPISYGNTNSSNAFVIGNINSANFTGLLGDMAVFTSTLTDIQIQKVQSYYAIKYGLTLDQSTPYNYLASNGAVIWNATANSSYSNNIAGIGQDNAGMLNQKQSRSVNTTGKGNMLTIGLGTIAATNAANSNSFSANRSFLVWGDNGGNVTGGDNTTDLPGGYLSRVNRLWKAQVTGTGVGPVQVQFDLNGITHAGTASSDFVLLIKRGGSNSSVLNESGATYVPVPAASYASGIVTFNGVSFQDNDIFALIDDPGTGLLATMTARMSTGKTIASEEKEQPIASVAPNPFRNSLTIRFSMPDAGPVVMSLVNMNGKEVKQRLWTAAAGENVMQWDNLGELPPGFYVLTIKGSGRIVSYKLVKTE